MANNLVINMIGTAHSKAATSLSRMAVLAPSLFGRNQSVHTTSMKGTDLMYSIDANRIASFRISYLPFKLLKR